jgi:hypothetical protein
MGYVFIRQVSHRIPDERLNDYLVTGASQVWLEFGAPTIVCRWPSEYNCRLSEHWFAATDRNVIYSATVH